jgi:hypothetical protein
MSEHPNIMLMTCSRFIMATTETVTKALDSAKRFLSAYNPELVYVVGSRRFCGMIEVIAKTVNPEMEIVYVVPKDWEDLYWVFRESRVIVSLIPHKFYDVWMNKVLGFMKPSSDKKFHIVVVGSNWFKCFDISTSSHTA